MVVYRSLLFELELNEYFRHNKLCNKLFVTSCLLHTLIGVCFENNASLESTTSLFNKVEELDEGSRCLKNQIGVSFGNLSLCLVPSA